MTKEQVTIDERSIDGLHSPTMAAVYDNHLELSDYLIGWAGSLRAEVGDTSRPPLDERDFLLGYMRALNDLAGHLRLGDGLPGGPLNRDA